MFLPLLCYVCSQHVFFEFQLSKHSPRRVLQLNVSALALVAILLLAGSSAQAAPVSRRLLEQTHSARRNLLVSTLCRQC